MKSEVLEFPLTLTLEFLYPFSHQERQIAELEFREQHEVRG